MCKRNRAWREICAHDRMQAHACMYTQSALSNKDAIIEKDPRVSVATLLGCRCYYLPGTCSGRVLPQCLPQLRLETLRWQTKAAVSRNIIFLMLLLIDAERKLYMFDTFLAQFFK